MSGAVADRVIIARIGAAHGIKGEVRVKAFTETPADIAVYGPLNAPDGRTFEVETLRPAAGTSHDMLVVRFKGVADRNQAETLTGIELGVSRDRLPKAGPEEFYHADLVGLAVMTIGGEQLGTIVAVQNYGAGDLLEVAPPRGETLLIPFTHAVVPEVDPAAGRVVVDPPEGLLDEGAKGEDAP